ncbi:unnamed protein product [Ilex paraguariensis]|uniref:Uncharacterized protein n=1 Tax=Ilex paraguariensis TaxID=185542 RepID=A0ABC8R4R5_9AQUA
MGQRTQSVIALVSHDVGNANLGVGYVSNLNATYEWLGRVERSVAIDLKPAVNGATGSNPKWVWDGDVAALALAAGFGDVGAFTDHVRAAAAGGGGVCLGCDQSEHGSLPRDKGSSKPKQQQHKTTPVIRHKPTGGNAAEKCNKGRGSTTGGNAEGQNSS